MLTITNVLKQMNFPSKHSSESFSVKLSPLAHSLKLDLLHSQLITCPISYFQSFCFSLPTMKLKYLCSCPPQ